MTTATEAAAILETMEVTCDFQHVPTSYDPNSKEWQGIAWKVTIKTPRGQFTTDFRQGIGHLPKVRDHGNGDGKVRTVSITGHPATLHNFEGINLALQTGKIPAYRFGWHPTKDDLPTPAPADVLYCLFSDAQAGQDDFPDFCANFGYDEDSRKAEATWLACRDTSAALHRIFTGEQFDRLAEVLADL